MWMPELGIGHNVYMAIGLLFGLVPLAALIHFAVKLHVDEVSEEGER